MGAGAADEQAGWRYLGIVGLDYFGAPEIWVDDRRAPTPVRPRSRASQGLPGRPPVGLGTVGAASPRRPPFGRPLEVADGHPR
jgi:hypothetical protein